ncbi:MAG: hypothetical protein KF744_03835 [Taibaiella sp.]|nr:hypothetical protein [Taibaiella sp.]
MLFTRTQRYVASIPKEEFKRRLAGNHVKIHDLDFEVYEKGQKLRIVPHAEQETDIKTLPITDVVFREAGDNMEVIVTSKIRKIDLGGPQLVILFCVFLLSASVALYLVGRERMEVYALMSICLITFGIFWLRMERGYFDYVRKIRAFVKGNLAPARSE